MYSLTGKSPTRAGHHHFAVCPLGLYKAKDQYICIIALDHQWPSLCDAMGRPDLVTDERYKTNAIRCTRVQEVVGIVQGWVDSLPSAEAVLAALHPVILQVAQEATSADIDQIGSGAVRSDLAAMRHETMDVRIFRT
jgi:crotonobetainyl-CoA:carnitine CoA-transferase CaiB-like acyl-CoA transferase